MGGGWTQKVRGRQILEVKVSWERGEGGLIYKDSSSLTTQKYLKTLNLLKDPFETIRMPSTLLSQMNLMMLLCPFKLAQGQLAGCHHTNTDVTLWQKCL